jgi:chemotaxis protein MotB
MKSFKISFLVAGATALIAFSSCKPVYKCGEAKPERFSAGNRLTDVVKERDLLCDQIKHFESENIRLTNRLQEVDVEIGGLRSNNTTLREEIASLQRENNRLKEEMQANKAELIELQAKFSQLYTNKGHDAEMYNKRIRDKEAELEAKERLIAANEALLKTRELEIQDRERAILELQRKLDRQDSITKAINQALKDALIGFQSDEISVETRDGKVYLSLSNKLLFKSGSIDVESKGQDAIRILGEVLVKNPEIDVMVEGHTDNVPIKTAQYRDNWDLSVARATTIVRLLTTNFKVPPTRLTAAGRGEFVPKASNDSADGRAMNRRTEIILTPNLEKILKMIGE